MRIELGKYRVNVPYIQEWTKNKDISDIPRTASVLAIILNLHLVVVYTYLGEILGFNNEITSELNRLKDFYQITEVVE